MEGGVIAIKQFVFFWFWAHKQALYDMTLLIHKHIYINTCTHLCQLDLSLRAPLISQYLVSAAMPQAIYLLHYLCVHPNPSIFFRWSVALFSSKSSKNNLSMSVSFSRYQQNAVPATTVPAAMLP